MSSLQCITTYATNQLLKILAIILIVSSWSPPCVCLALRSESAQTSEPIILLSFPLSPWCKCGVGSIFKDQVAFSSVRFYLLLAPLTFLGTCAHSHSLGCIQWANVSSECTYSSHLTNLCSELITAFYSWLNCWLFLLNFCPVYWITASPTKATTSGSLRY